MDRTPANGLKRKNRGSEEKGSATDSKSRPYTKAKRTLQMDKKDSSKKICMEKFCMKMQCMTVSSD